MNTEIYDIMLENIKKVIKYNKGFTNNYIRKLYLML